MDIHKPKPWRGAREFLKEIGTIVIGVLIALGAEQVAVSLRDRHAAAEARRRGLHRDPPQSVLHAGPYGDAGLHRTTAP
jgi:hypothetical protein